ncbi:MAG: DUF4129 domain-containing protein [Myxococcota bacterium]
MRGARLSSPLDRLDRALSVVRRGGLGVLGPAWLGGAVPALVVLVVFHLEVVEGVRSLRPALALALVGAWWARSVAQAVAARRAVRALWPVPSLPVRPARPLAVIRLASVVGVGLWVWLWIPVAASFLGPVAVVLSLPLLAPRGAVAPTWLARAGCAPEGGLRAFARAVRDGAGQRAAGLAVEGLVLGGAVLLFTNLFLAAGLSSHLARSVLGLQTALFDAFFSTGNLFVWVAVGAATLVLLEPLRAAQSAVFYLDARFRREGLDLEAMVDAAIEAGGGKADGPGRAARASRAATWILALLTATAAPIPAHAQPPTPRETEPGTAQHPREPKASPRLSESEASRGARGHPLEEGGGAGGMAETNLGGTAESHHPREPKASPRLSESEASRGARGHPLEEGGGAGGMAEIEAAVERVLARPEFREVDGERETSLAELLDRLMAAIVDWLERAEELEPRERPAPPPLPLPPAGFFLIAGGLLFALVVGWVVSSRVQRGAGDEGSRPGGDGTAAPDPRDRPPAAHLDDAARLAAAGRHREALRALYLATLVALDRRGLLVFDTTRTNRHHLRQLPPGALREELEHFTRLFERTWYGDEPTTEADYGEGHRLAERFCAPEGQP